MITQRPGYGSEGKVFVAVSNFRTLRLSPGFRTCLCSVVFEPSLPEEAAGQRRRVIEQNKQEVLAATKSADLICTGGNVYLLSRDEEGFEGEVVLDLQMNHQRENDEGRELQDGEDIKGYRVTIKAKREVRIEDEMLLNEDERTYFNIIINRALRDSRLQQIGRYHYDTMKPLKVDCSPPLHLIPGYFTSVQVCEYGPALMYDVKHRIVQEKTVAEVMNEILQANAYNGKTNDEKKFLLEQLLIKKVVITRHTQPWNMYIIEGIEMDMNPLTSTFERREGPITHQDYFLEQYNLELSPVRMPMLRCSRRKRDVFLPADFCFMTGLTDQLKGDYRVMNAISQYTRMLPRARFEKGNEVPRKLTDGKSREVLENWKIEVAENSLECEGRQVETAKVRVMTSNHDLEAVQRGDGHTAGAEVNWNRVNFPHLIQKNVVGFQTNPGFQRWVLIHTARDQPLVPRLIDALGEELIKKNMRAEPPKIIEINAVSPEEFKNEMIRELKQLPSRPDIILVILPRQNTDEIYAIIKAEFCTGEMACPSQCIKAATIDKKGAQAAAKLFDQMICKQGGFLWGLNAPQTCRTMVVGVDLNTTGGRTIASFAASFNYSYTKYFSHCTWIRSREDAAEPLALFLHRALDNFRDNFEEARGPVEEKRYPNRIFIYRDGVSEAAKQLLKDFEIQSVLNRFTNLDNEWAKEVEFAYVLVNKKIHQRFGIKPTPEMLQNRGRGGRGNAPREDLTNALPLTIFDSGVTASDKFDFFISHQEVTQGSVTPTHYDVLYWKPGNMSVDDLQRLPPSSPCSTRTGPGPSACPPPSCTPQSSAPCTRR
uniref:Piwi domain-containing protein n=1 Tax=Chromera velia CCMP2878 TaxID=1169474 RepID=A0A0G4HE51_9ALVE|eukprot:Cvel_982.t1-p1 / transcript=Cvel_982.t1 / gene=Cvel_982 / organism=Chromera_velia_CCMP2878 / gene_product=Piwi-like protein 1, putative / transcript_product=Piwi-like protein 1, putative / location=Cvel_scaffold31:169108-174124(+) / protein_length=823 / sequence_SO=supercontig / SO=protein_coding / is_pseudo=false